MSKKQDFYSISEDSLTHILEKRLLEVLFYRLKI